MLGGTTYGFKNSNQKFSVLLFLFLLLFIHIACEEDPPVIPPQLPPVPEFSIEKEDVSCTEIWLNLKVSDTIGVNLFRNDSLIHQIDRTDGDTIIYEIRLLPNQNYTYRAEININNKIYSRETTVQTMDTTSQNFTWQRWEFGSVGSSIIYDMAIINENNIWAVGDIALADTGINGSIHYNAVHWNGSEWELKRILFYTVCGQSHQNAYIASSIYALSENIFWISLRGGQITKIEGNIQKHIICIPWSFRINKIWAKNQNDIYVVGDNGNIARYQNGLWTKVESGTEYNINDIWGDYNEKTGEWEILAVAGNILQGWQLEREIIKINENTTQILTAEGTYWPLRTLWYKSENKYYVGGSGIYEKKSLTEDRWKNGDHDISTFSINKMRGDFINNIAAAGGVGEVLHYNGLNWKSYIDITRLNNGNYYSVGIKDNIIIAVGSNNPKAVIVMGKRN